MDMVYTNAIIPTSWAHYHCLCYLYLDGCSWVIRWIPGTLPRINVHLYLCFCFSLYTFQYDTIEVNRNDRNIQCTESTRTCRMESIKPYHEFHDPIPSTLGWKCETNIVLQRKSGNWRIKWAQNHSNLELRCPKWNHSINHSTNFCLAYTNLATRVESQRIVGQSPLSTLTIPGCQ